MNSAGEFMDARPLFFALLFVACCNPAQADECPAYIEPRITVTPVFTEPQYDNTTKADELKSRVLIDKPNAWIGALRSHMAEEGVRIGGVTRLGDLLITTTGAIKPYKLKEKIFCAQIIEFSLSIRTTTTTVNIANEFPPNSCSYDLVLGHELKHVAVAKNFLNKAAPVMQKYLQDFFHGLGVVQGQSVEEVMCGRPRHVKSDVDVRTKKQVLRSCVRPVCVA